MMECMRALISFLIFFVGITLFEYHDPNDDDYTSSQILLNLLNTLLSTIAVLLFLHNIKVTGDYHKYIGFLSNKVNVYENYGYVKLTVISILLFIH